ncbi:hypothetical protein HPB48_006960 [Haemaphysalis longicornis]|uniref:MD-2-related lipid-recognition domain-containing protein n=1 Tax=Haemaphysalis longicornis TaxID=44386 RepID=A0A9J6GPF4_HAELO|nr:hypothetical protein HPB48_006960 [Haemaphysalis longicornis]
MKRPLRITHQDSKRLRLEPTMNVLGLKLPVPGIERDLCKEAYPCPIVKGRRFKLSLHGTGSRHHVSFPIFSPRTRDHFL